MTTPSSTPSDVSADPTELPDEAELERLANEFFAEQFGDVTSEDGSMDHGTGDLLSTSAPLVGLTTVGSVDGVPADVPVVLQETDVPLPPPIGSGIPGPTALVPKGIPDAPLR